jgi:cell division protein FtsI (penicillin-binding protein 3)
VCLLAFALALVARSAYVQLWRGAFWAARAAQEHATAAPMAAQRGAILDAAGTPLASTREVLQLGVAPQEVRDRTGVARALVEAGVPVEWAKRAVDPRRSWVSIPTRLLPGAAARVTAMRGVYSSTVAERLLLASPGLAGIIGHVGATGSGVDGLEAALDSVLRGDSGRTVQLHDALGHTLESPAAPPPAGQPGDVVELTLNQALQEICERALGDALDQLGATGGDIVVLDPNDGSVLALASRRAGLEGAATTITEPFEPGSTLKPFIAAALLERNRVAPQDVVDTHTGQLVINGRTVRDTHVAPQMTLREVIRWSSNTGIIQFAERLSRREEYEALRDAGFGTPTGLPVTGETGGTLRDPGQWSLQSPASLAIGYELAVTPLQLALAYGAIANGGLLLEPALVREIRRPDGTVVYHRERRVVRRLMPAEVASDLRGVLIETVKSGTATKADLASFVVAGKTGTARRTQFGGGYARNEYTASFVGLFPGRDPQFVILVKLDNPTGTYFGGAAAAPVFKAVMEAAIAARDAALDRRALAADQRVALIDTAASALPAIDSTAVDSAVSEPQIGVTIPLVGRPASAPVPGPALVSIPDVRALPLRTAVRRLHAAGVRVEITGGAPGVTVPEAGAAVRRGSVVRLGDGS